MEKGLWTTTGCPASLREQRGVQKEDRGPSTKADREEHQWAGWQGLMCGFAAGRKEDMGGMVRGAAPALGLRSWCTYANDRRGGRRWREEVKRGKELLGCISSPRLSVPETMRVAEFNYIWLIYQVAMNNNASRAILSNIKPLTGGLQ